MELVIIIIIIIIIILLLFSLVSWLACLTTDHKVAGSIPGSSILIVVLVHPVLVTNGYSVYEVIWSPACLVSPGCTRNPSFSLQWKSDESTKNYLTQMLHWRYWQMGKNSRMRMKIKDNLI